MTYRNQAVRDEMAAFYRQLRKDEPAAARLLKQRMGACTKNLLRVLQGWSGPGTVTLLLDASK